MSGQRTPPEKQDTNSQQDFFEAGNLTDNYMSPHSLTPQTCWEFQDCEIPAVCGREELHCQPRTSATRAEGDTNAKSTSSKKDTSRMLLPA